MYSSSLQLLHGDAFFYVSIVFIQYPPGENYAEEPEVFVNDEGAIAGGKRGGAQF